MNTTAKQLLKETIVKIDGAYAPATIRAYKANFERFISFCEKLKTCALPADSDSVKEYIKQLSGGSLKSASIRIAIAAISSIHKLNQLIDPTTHPDVKLEMRRMHRKLGRESSQAIGIDTKKLQQLLAELDDSLIDLRDRALVLTAYDGMCRRSELVSLNVEDISYHDDSTLKLKLRRSKTDQDGMGRWLHLSKKTSIAIKEWLGVANIDSGKIFRGIKPTGEISDRLCASQINRIYKKLARNSKIDPKKIKHISGHSVRVGAAQDMLIAGETLAKIMQRGRWSKTDTVMRYIENATLA